MIRAAIDMGSNTLRFLVANIENNQITERLCYQHCITRLGENLHQTGYLSSKAMVRTTEAIKSFKQEIDAFGAIEVCATATAAVRKAKNGRQFLQTLAKDTSIQVQLISEQCEAELCLRGVTSEFSETNFLLFDIGGGSTEFSRINNKQLLDSQSHALGVVEMTERLLHTDPPSPYDFIQIQKYVDTFLHNVEKSWNDLILPTYLVGTAGTITTLAALDLKLKHYDAQQVNGHTISIDALQKLKQKLLSLNFSQRSHLDALESGRADLIIAGMAIVERLMLRWHYKHLVCIDSGLLEGAVLLGNQALQIHPLPH